MFFDVVFISYDESNADENWSNLLEKVPYAIRIHNIKGISNAHIEAAKQVTTSHFFCVDADNIVNDTFDFENVIDFQSNDQRVHVWCCSNIVNGLQYGYGGIKLFPTDHVEYIKDYSIDFCTSVATASGGFKLHKEVASTTHFNTTPFDAWKSGFRECTKLASTIITGQKDYETFARLKLWISLGLDVNYGDYAIAGARMGTCYGVSNKETSQQTLDNLNNINDFDFCRDYFSKHVEKSNIMDIIKKYGIDIDDFYNMKNILFTAEQSEFLKSVLYKL